MKTETYSLSFTTGTLLHRESVIIAEQFLALHTWNAVRDIVVSQNLLQTRTLNTSKRFCQEVISRLRTLDHNALELLVQGSLQEQGYLLWLGTCCRYQFIADFAQDILHEKFISFKTVLTYDDFNAFFNQKAEWHDELERIQPATKAKLRQVLFKMLREAGLLSPDHHIIPALLSPRLISTVARGNVQNLLIFPAFESDLRLWAQ